MDQRFFSRTRVDFVVVAAAASPTTTNTVSGPQMSKATKSLSSSRVVEICKHIQSSSNNNSIKNYKQIARCKLMIDVYTPTFACLANQVSFRKHWTGLLIDLYPDPDNLKQGKAKQVKFGIQNQF